MRHALVTTLENTPVIPAVKTPEELPAALRAEGGGELLLCGDILNIGELIARIHAANRRAVVHADLVAGLAPREIAVDFLQCCGADGIISTRPLLIRRGRELGLYNILGLEKRHIAHVMVWETLYCAAAAILGGLAAGLLLSKLVLLLLLAKRIRSKRGPKGGKPEKKKAPRKEKKGGKAAADASAPADELDGADDSMDGFWVQYG